MRRTGILAGLLVALALPVSASATTQPTQLIGPYGEPMHALTKMIDRSRLPLPATTIDVWPMRSLPGSASDGGAYIWGARPFWIFWPARPFLEAVFFEVAHVADDGWMTDAQREHFAAIGGYPAHDWLTPQGDAAGTTTSDNFAGAYAVAAMFGPHPHPSEVVEYASLAPSKWRAEYAIVREVADASEHMAAQTPSASAT